MTDKEKRLVSPAAEAVRGDSNSVAALLEVRDLRVAFDLGGGRTLQAVSSFSLQVFPGERVGLVGESGCGKTTAVLALMGLLPPTATVGGKILFEGEDILHRGEDSLRPHRWRDIAIVFQGAMNAFNPVKTIGAQIAEPITMYGTEGVRNSRDRVAELLELVGIPGARASSYPHVLSGGMRQRAAIAMALACRPKLLLADEPTTSLDVMIQAQILELLAELTDELRLSLLLVTHDLALVAQHCSQTVVMYAGRVVEEGTPDVLYHHPGHPYTRLLFASTPDVFANEKPVSIPGAPPRLDAPVRGCVFAPRCDRTFSRCSTERPASRALAPRHTAACHLNDSPEVDSPLQ